MRPPPEELLGRRVLEYVIFDADVKRTDRRAIRAAPGPEAVISALAICESNGRRPTIELCYCDSQWNIDSLNVWGTDGPWMVFRSILDVRHLAESRYSGTLDKWIHVAAASAVFETNSPVSGA